MTTELTRHGSRRGQPENAQSRRARTSPGGLHTEPRVDLLPPEVKTSRRQDAIARRLVLTLGVVILVVAGGIGGSTLLAVQANASLDATQAETQSLALQQQKYGAVQSIQKQIALTQAAQQVGASTEIDWMTFLGKVNGTTGPGLAVTGFTIDSASPLAAYPQSPVPLQGARVATVTVNVKAASLDVVSAWLARLETLASVADVAPGTFTLDKTGYTGSAIMHLNVSAFDGRFAQKGK